MSGPRHELRPLGKSTKDELRYPNRFPLPASITAEADAVQLLRRLILAEGLTPAQTSAPLADARDADGAPAYVYPAQADARQKLLDRARALVGPARLAEIAREIAEGQ